MLKELISQGEGPNLEFKRTINTALGIAKTLAAFANTSGGILLVGVNDNGAVCGIVSEEEEMQKVEEATDYVCQPPVNVSYKINREEGKQVLVVSVAESAEKPHYIQGSQREPVVYIRAKDKSVPIGKAMRNVLDSTPTNANAAVFQTPHVKALVSYLRKNEFIDGKKFAKLVNISERRADKLLYELTRQHILLMQDWSGPLRFTLK